MKNGLTLLPREHTTRGNLVFFWWAICCVVGISVPVTLKLFGILTAWSEDMMRWFIQPPFNMSEQAFVPSSLALFCFGVGVTMFFTWAVLHLNAMWQRILVIVGGTVSMLLFIPISALWQIFFNTVGSSLALLISGVCASLACLLIDRNREQSSSPQNDEPA